MGILSGLHKRATSYPGAHPRDPGLAALYGWGQETASGAVINEDNALEISTVYACVRVIAETLAMLPLILYRRQGDTKTRAVNHPLYRVLHSKPNRWQTSFQWREMMAGHVLLRGNAYSEIVPTGGLGVAELIPLHPDRVRPEQLDDMSIVYEYTPPSGRPRVILQSEMHHFCGLSLDGVTGISPIKYHRETLGLSAVTLEHGARTFKNGAKPGGVLTHPGTLNDGPLKRLKAQWQDDYAGASNAGKTLVLEEGMDWKQIGLTNEDAQYLETRKFQRSEIASIYRIPPHLIGDLEKSTFSNIEHQGLEFVKYTMAPWFARWEQAISRDFLTDRERDRYFAEFLVDGLLRGDIKSRYDAYSVGRQWGWLSANDVRNLENMNPIDEGDEYLSPLNMIPASQIGQDTDNQGDTNGT